MFNKENENVKKRRTEWSISTALNFFSVNELIDIIYKVKESKNNAKSNKPSIDELLSEPLERLEFHQKLNKLIFDKDLSHTDIIRDSGIKKSYYYQILSGEKKRPSRDKVIQLVFGLKLTPWESEVLLKSAGHNDLNKYNKRDNIIYFCISNKYSIHQANEELDKYNEPILGIYD